MSRSDYDILIVEDTPEFAKLTMLTLERYGYDNAHHAINGEEAMRYVEERKPALMLLDLNLPGMSGWQVLDALKERHGELPVIVTTAQSDSANRVVGKLQNVFKYLVKPFSPQDLVKTIDAALGFE
jgi:DNA-binding response OmpR family regulator